MTCVIHRREWSRLSGPTLLPQYFNTKHYFGRAIYSFCAVRLYLSPIRLVVVLTLQKVICKPNTLMSGKVSALW